MKDKNDSIFKSWKQLYRSVYKKNRSFDIPFIDHPYHNSIMDVVNRNEKEIIE